MSIGRKRSSITVFVLLVFFGLVASACGSSSTEPAADIATAPAPTQVASETVTESAPAAQPSLLVGEFESADGTIVDLADFQGQDVLLWFWEPW